MREANVLGVLSDGADVLHPLGPYTTFMGALKTQCIEILGNSVQSIGVFLENVGKIPWRLEEIGCEIQRERAIRANDKSALSPLKLRSNYIQENQKNRKDTAH